MTEGKELLHVCANCSGQLPRRAEVCPWCGAPAGENEHRHRIRVRKRRSPARKYFEHVRRHWIYFVLAVIAALAAAWLLLDWAQRPTRPPAPAFILWCVVSSLH